MITRRQFLIGGAAGVGGLALGAAVAGPDRLLYKAGLRHSPDHRVPASGWPIEEYTLTSAAMGGDVAWAMAVPPGGAEGLIVCLHGRSNDHRFAFDHIFLHDVVADLGHRFAVAAVDGGTRYWHRRADGTDTLAMVLDEWLPAVDQAVDREVPRAVVGWSMGGYGALLVAERAPAEFRAVAAASPALWLPDDTPAPGAFDDDADRAAHDVFAGVDTLASMAVRVDCGTSDGFLPAAQRFADMLPRPNLGTFSSGYHDDAYWRSIAPAQVATIADAFT